MRTKFDRTQDHPWATVDMNRALTLHLELLTVVRHEVTCEPVAVKHRRKLRNNVRVSGCGNTNVPLQSGHRCGASEIRRTDVCGSESRLPVEHPGLRVQTRGAQIVG